jgi:thiazole synthase
MTATATIPITVNGEPRRIQAGATIAIMLRQLGLDPARVAVERNLAIVPRSTIGEAPVAAGDKFEIVHFVGGG